MENKKTRLISYCLIGSLLLVFGFYSNTILYAHAVSVISVTFATGTTTTDVSYVKIAEGSSNNAQAYIVGTNAGSAFIWSKPSNSDTITNNKTLTGSGSASAVQYHSKFGFIYVATNDKFYKISPALAIAGQFATGQAATTIDFQYDVTNNILYFCYNDGYGSLNPTTLVPTVLYTDPGATTVFGCSLDVVGGAMYLSGDNIGTASASDLIKISLSTHTQSAGVAIGVDFFYGNCVDDIEHEVWALESSNARVRHYDSSLNQIALVTVGTTPRHCSISDDSGARRLYVANEGTNNISIVDIDADVIVTTSSVCDTVAGRKLDTFRGFNVTRTFVTCNSNVNSIVLDDTVSESAPDISSDEEFCLIPGNENLLRCFTTAPLTGTSQLLNQSSTDIICMIGLLPCTQDPVTGEFTPNNPDIKTNGVGYWVAIVAFGILISIFWLASGGKIQDIPTFIWFIASIAVLGGLIGFGFLDPTFLIIGIIAIIALATAKVKGIFGGSGLFSE